MSEIGVTRKGEGPVVLLVHGGASPATTWSVLDELAERWTLMLVHRRGYPPSPPPAAGQDFEVDAADVEGLLQGRPHVVAHSYGVLAAIIAASRRPQEVRSLTLIEPPLYYLLPEDSEVANFERMGDHVLRAGLDADPVTLRRFLKLTGAPGVDDGPLPDDVANGVRRAQGTRPPGEARPALSGLREAAVPSLVASGAHSPPLERICDALAAELDAERIITPGAGHFVQAAPGFAAQLEGFLRSVP